MPRVSVADQKPLSAWAYVKSGACASVDAGQSITSTPNTCKGTVTLTAYDDDFVGIYEEPDCTQGCTLGGKGSGAACGF